MQSNRAFLVPMCFLKRYYLEVIFLRNVRQVVLLGRSCRCGAHVLHRAPEERSISTRRLEVRILTCQKGSVVNKDLSFKAKAKAKAKDSKFVLEDI